MPNKKRGKDRTGFRSLKIGIYFNKSQLLQALISQPFGYPGAHTHNCKSDARLLPIYSAGSEENGETGGED